MNEERFDRLEKMIGGLAEDVKQTRDQVGSLSQEMKEVRAEVVGLAREVECIKEFVVYEAEKNAGYYIDLKDDIGQLKKQITDNSTTIGYLQHKSAEHDKDIFVLKQTFAVK